jgi:hypothetical protein
MIEWKENFHFGRQQHLVLDEVHVCDALVVIVVVAVVVGL